jgi:hypothetical protein
VAFRRGERLRVGEMERGGGGGSLLDDREARRGKKRGGLARWHVEEGRGGPAVTQGVR